MIFILKEKWPYIAIEAMNICKDCMKDFANTSLYLNEYIFAVKKKKKSKLGLLK